MIALVPLALAINNAPGVVKEALNLTQLPDCMRCHNTSSGDEETATTPFGRAMKAAGATPNNPESLTQAVKKIETDKTDSDGDGMPDTDELKAGANPNGNSDIVHYGCQSVPGMGSLALVIGLRRDHFRRRARPLH